MNTAAQYAKAMYNINSKSDLLPKLRDVLERRGHQKLLSRIFAEYQKLSLAEERSESRKKITPAEEQTRILLELYQKLTR